MIISNEVSVSIAEFLASEKSEDRRLLFNKATTIMSKDLNLNRLESITEISCLQYDKLQKKLANKAKIQ